MNEWVKQNALALVVYALTLGFVYGTMDTRISYAESEIAEMNTIPARIAVLESEIKANTRAVEGLAGYIKGVQQGEKIK